nr:trihelix transcription factor GT-2-like [Ipomoea batatas]
MLETPVLLQNSSDEGGGAAAAAAELKKNNEGGGEWNSGGNRWPHEETLALLNIRSQMELAFRDSSSSSSSHKVPLWDEVSRKMGELGYHRNAKKCKEKFENIYKYHKRTKEGRSGRRQNAKNYRFFQQLELFDSHHSLLPSPTSHQIQIQIQIQNTLEKPTLVSPATRLTMLKPTTSLSQDDLRIQQPCHTRGDFSLDVNSTTSSSSGKESQGIAKRKRKLGDYFDKLMKEVLEKQEGLHSKFLEAIEKCDKDRMAREEAWKRQEMERLKREQESIAQGRAIAAAKDAAIIAFLQKITQQPVPLPTNPTPISPKCVENQESVLEKNIGDGSEEDVVEKGNDVQDNVAERSSIEKREKGGCGESNSVQTSSSRWPREEVEALIRVRRNLDLQYQDNGSKGPLWEEISAGMKKVGYDRSAKRCKEKWENINKYYRRVKETQKKRPEDSKTCPYFHLLDSLYQSKSRRVEHRGSDVPKSKGEMLVQIMRQNQEEEEATGKEDGERPSVDQNEENDDE